MLLGVCVECFPFVLFSFLLAQKEVSNENNKLVQKKYDEMGLFLQLSIYKMILIQLLVLAIN